MVIPCLIAKAQQEFLKNGVIFILFDHYVANMFKWILKHVRLFENIKIYLSSFYCMERTEFLHTLVILRYKALIHLKLNHIKMCFQRFKPLLQF